MRKVMRSIAVLISIPFVLAAALVLVLFAVTWERAAALDKVWR